MMKTLNSPRFDWMQATIRDDVLAVADTLAGTLSADLEDARGLNGYRQSFLLKRNDETLARLLYGGNGSPHLIATGAATDDVVPVLRSGWSGVHDVTRMDTAQDFDHAGGYDLLRSMMLDLAGTARLSETEIVSTRNGIRSRTTYLGSPSSRVRVRLYEKGCMEHQNGNSDAPADWVRLEAQVRPTGHEARARAAELDPLEAWGLSSWTRDLARLAMGADVERVTMRGRREPDYMRAIRSLERQYGPTLAKAMKHEGSWEKVGQLLGVVS